MAVLGWRLQVARRWRVTVDSKLGDDRSGDGYFDTFHEATDYAITLIGGSRVNDQSDAGGVDGTAVIQEVVTVAWVKN